MILILFALALGYLVGSVPSGVVLSRAVGAPDPRGIGSGNIGATNVLRSGRKGLAAATLIADAVKGTIAVLVARLYADPSTHALLPLAAGAGAFFGHLFSLFLGFKGGKGVATFLGCLFGIAWLVALAFCGVWITLAAITRYSSAAALAASAAAPLLLLAVGRPAAAVVFGVMACALWAKHHANISRLLAGSESRIGGKARAARTAS